MTHPIVAVLAAGESGQAGPMGLLVVILLGISVYFLGRSLARHLGRLPPTFGPPETADTAQPTDAGQAGDVASDPASAEPADARIADVAGTGNAARVTDARGGQSGPRSADPA